MRNRWSKFAALAGLLSASALMVPGLSAQNKKEQKVQKMVVTKAHKSRGLGQDPNIKHKSDLNDPSRPAPRPAGQ
ncbi:MAG TPA: hypothetical protein VEG08_06000 [Terriglobales bacterium]|nr:hypothetical protein [Terriglobales bacterium]